jgi:hypothetical protein
MLSTNGWRNTSCRPSSTSSALWATIANITDAERHTASLDAREILTLGGFEGGNSSELARAISETRIHTAKMSDGARTLYQNEERAKLERLWGGAFKANAELTLAFIDKMHAARPGTADKPSLWTILDRAGGLNARTATLIFHRAQAFAAARNPKQ